MSYERAEDEIEKPMIRDIYNISQLIDLKKFILKSNVRRVRLSDLVGKELLLFNVTQSKEYVSEFKDQNDKKTTKKGIKFFGKFNGEVFIISTTSKIVISQINSISEKLVQNGTETAMIRCMAVKSNDGALSLIDFPEEAKN